LVLSIGVIVAVSGCTSSENTNKTDQQFSDLKLANTASVMHHSDGSGNIFGGIVNKGSSTYSNVDVQVTGYDSNKNIVYQKTQTISSISPGQVGDVSIVLNGHTDIDYVDMKVVNATKT